ncbi:ribosomal protein L1p/L10e family-domain-containing protein [Syncephalastrum racemosum]|uniref:Ribosomal protein L1p/L10e family-domain-containing protein n=1 Tax=Syncephalastrum racemosum TaxID=13706 RepID=A0A1X2HVL5_SYNRA|nr:ribosomal protein L1p/L10e family-domain-containing protein [Syncephalastrum racemosum]
MPLVDLEDRQLQRALRTLFKHEEGEINNIWLMINTKVTVPTRDNVRPKRIPLRHSLHEPGTQRCLFTKNPQKKYHDMLVERKVKGIHKVLSLGKLKKMSPAEKKQLRITYGAFFVDQSILQQLRPVLGGEIYKKRCEPIPISLSSKDLQKEVLDAVRSTYMHFNRGSTYNVKIGTTALNDTQVMDNLRVSLPAILRNLYKGPGNVKTLHIQVSGKTPLPIFEAKDSEGNEENEEQKEEESSDEEDEDEE